jgi:inorganic triphosphatase YgiF
MLEVELKFLARDSAALERLATVPGLGRAALGSPETYDELDRYLDTDDGRLAAERWACRLRTRRGATIISLKGPAQPHPGGHPALHRRPEVEGPATPVIEPDEWPASEARDRLIELSAGHPLVERLALAQRRTERPVTVEGRGIGLLSLDRVTILHAGVEMGRLCCVELESAGPDAEAIVPLAAALAAIDGLAADRQTKLERALGMIERART